MASTFGNQVDSGFNISGSAPEQYIMLVYTMRCGPFNFPATAPDGATVRIVTQHAESGSFVDKNINISPQAKLGGVPGGERWLSDHHVYSFIFNAATSKWDLSDRDLRSGPDYGPVII